MTSTLPADQVKRITQYLPVRLAKELVGDLPAQRMGELTSALTLLREGVTAYLPRYLVQVVQADPAPGHVGCYFKSGTVMFADVSGFTAMSEKLAVLGKEGAEEMTGIVNAYFEAMLDISVSMGGDLLKFGGDALMIFFEGDHGPQRALHAANSMQAAMSDFTSVETSQGVFPLRMSIGMASGLIILLNLGSVEQMYYTVMGRTLGRMARMEEQATANQVVVDRLTADKACDLATFDEIAEGAFLLETFECSESEIPAVHPVDQREKAGDAPGNRLLSELELLEALSPYVPAELLSKLIADPNHPVRRSSHRPVTNMFANFIGLDEIVEDLGPERTDEILAISEAYFGAMAQILNRYGGTISRLDNYSIGQRILALFGALQAHEDDPERAVRAGLEMQAALGSVNQQIQITLSESLKSEARENALTQRIGINTGFVFAGSVGSPRRREYTVMGAQVNLTARLMSIARDGDVLIGGSTARHVEGRYTLASRAPVKVKGIDEPVPSYVVGREVREHSRLTRPAGMPIQGREGELEQSRVLVGDVLKGHGRSLVISGESGMGKSRLIDEIVSESLESGIQVLEGACLSYGRTMTYHPWAELLRALFGFDPDHDPARRITLLTNHMQTIGEDLFAPLIGQVLGLPIEDNDLTRDLDAKLRRQRVLDLILKLLQTRAKDQPLLVLIEDVHWADEVSLDLISYIARNIGNSAILFLLSHRPDEDLPDWSALPNTLKLALEGLSAEACLALVRGMLKDQPLSERFGEFILEKAGGNPLFLGEVIRNLLDAGTIFQDREGIWDLPEGVDTVELPDTIHGMIISRMDRLDSADRRMLQIASVVGRTFSTPTLIGVYDFGLEASELDQRIGVMASKGLVELMGADQFRFTHLTTQEVVYESLSYELKRDLHRRIGTHYEETHIGSLNEWIDLLAYHYFEGQAWPKAADYTLRAGRRAQREYANQAAVTACTKTLTAAEKLDVDEQILYTLPAYEVMGEVNSLTGEYDQAIDNFTSALTLVEESKPDIDQIISRADFHRKIAEVYERRSEFDIAFDWLGRSLTLLTKSRPTIVAAQARMLGAGIYRRLGKLDEAVQWCQESLEIAKGIETREGARTVAHANYSMSGIYWRLGDLEKALALASESLRIYTENDDIIGQARAFTNLSNAYADLGDWNRAMQALEKSLEINQRIGNIVSIGFVTNNMATIHLDRGEWDRAYELYQASREIWVKLGASMQEGIILSNLAQVHIYQGNWPEAESSLIESKHIFETLGSEDYLPELERRWAELYLQTDNLEAACAHAHQALEMASALEARLDLGTAFRVLGEIYLAQNNLEEAEMSLRRSARILQDLESEYEAAKVTLPLAALAKAKGEAPDIVALQAARATFERLGAQFDLGRTEDILKRI